MVQTECEQCIIDGVGEGGGNTEEKWKWWVSELWNGRREKKG